jgi:hypothetical protein
MRYSIRVTPLVALFGGRPTIAQTIGSFGPSVRSSNAINPKHAIDRRASRPPTTRARDVLSLDGLDRIGEEGAAVDRGC